MNQVRRYLIPIAERMAGRPLETEAAVISNPFASEAIVAYAAKHEADVIALATHGRGGLVRTTMGSTADEVLRETIVPVLLYRPRVDR